MRSINFISINLLALFLLVLSGCGDSDYAPVSGTVTSDGEPVAKLRVILSPDPIGDNNAVGPFSLGVTDANGQFSLQTRYGAAGAFIGQHTASFQYTDIGEDAMGELRDMMEDAKEGGDKAEFQEVKQKIAAMKAKLKGRPVLLRKYNGKIEVPPGGTSDLVIELNDIK